ncbi:MAG: HpaII family restriction endonuclease [Parasporobacterium sp.]|nr:HpaII family restriction endonuclease [Parasporobacterium sp.]
MITGNKGEWSELYVLLYLLGMQKLYAADDKLLKIENAYFPIQKIFRADKDSKVDYVITPDTHVDVYANNTLITSLNSEVFLSNAKYLYDEIIKGGDRAFTIDRIEKFMTYIHTHRLAAPSSDKTDISMQVYDIHTGYNPILGFSIKSELGGAPTLLNASGATNFVYEVNGISEDKIEYINAISTRTKILDRVQYIYDNGGTITYRGTANKTFAMNLMLIDSRMEEIIAAMLLYSYRTNTMDCNRLLKHLDAENPLNFPRKGFYSYKYMKLLSAIALGMNPSRLWDGLDDANGGYIVVKADGDVLAYHLYNRNFFEKYLLDNTRLERGSTTKHGYATLYKENGRIYIKLNLQIRFK